VNTEVVTTWKQEEGKWVWFLDVKGLWATPMGASNFAATQAAQQKNVVNADLVYQKPDGTIDLPADFSSPQNLAAQSAAILQKSGIDKTEVSLTFGVPAKQQITFHNGMNGAVMVELLGAPSGIPGLQVILEKQNVGAREDSAIRFQYDPPANEPVPDFATRSYTLNLLMQPFNQIFPVKLTINQSPAK
jgi:hypothetical protein